MTDDFTKVSAAKNCTMLTTPPDFSMSENVTRAEDDPVIMEMLGWSRDQIVKYRAALAETESRDRSIDIINELVDDIEDANADADEWLEQNVSAAKKE